MSRLDAHMPDWLRRAAIPLAGHDEGFDPLLDAIGDARFVLLGEATHGTHEFYSTRARITQQLIQRKGFTAVVAEADWPDAYRVNRFVRGMGDDADAALSGFKRFPTWMWRNADVLKFVTWLREHNSQLAPGQQPAGFYGMDLYSLYGSIEAVLNYLDRVDPAAAQRARHRYACFEHFGEDPQAYGYAASFDLDRSCEDQVIRQLIELRQHASDFASRDGQLAEDEYFQTEQNARLILNAEQYYRIMFGGRISSWNLRDVHMADTLAALADHLDRRHGRSRIVVWAHNSHLGDARATEMGTGGELNVGQLIRERHGRDAFLLGFTTYTGSVTAASAWDGPAQLKAVRPSLDGSFERLFHDTGLPQFLLLTGGDTAALLHHDLLERAIGVVYLPETERISHYFRADLGRQFDAVIHFDATRAVAPLEQWVPVQKEVPETYPTGV